MAVPLRKKVQIAASLILTLVGLSIILSPTDRIPTPASIRATSLYSQIHYSHRGNSKYRRDIAVATFLTGESESWKYQEDGNYLIATRTLTYQLRHSPRTRLDPSIPFLILVTDDVSAASRERLTEDGAIVIPVDKVQTNLTVTEPRWKDCWTKLRLFDPNIVPYERVLFMDGDTVLTRPIDGVFDDPAAQFMYSQKNGDEIKPDEPPLPERYLFAGKTEAGTYEHSFPPDTSGNYLNAGFFLYSPSHEIMHYYMSVLSVPDRFDPMMPGQNLLNYAHRQEGNMPWQKLSYTWNMNFVTPQDMEGGVASLHVKSWDKSLQQEVIDYALRCRWEMEGFWIGVNATRENL
ncbi:CAZyme family GT8 [Paecilomyces variotii]|nr:CAZyme family GT8 [Paecilomyces variotii]KAJ9240708.1 CAZyme family GT8 [Paecilomyces variotii]